MEATTIIYRVMKLFGHMVVATCGVIIPTFVLGYAVAAAFDPQGRIIDYFFVAPTFGLPLGVGVLFGYRLGWRLRPLESWVICLPPLAFVASGVYVNRQNGLPWGRAWAKFFGASCAGQDCYFQFGAQVIATAPLMAALGYAIGAEFGRRQRREESTAGPSVYAKWRGWAFIALLVLGILSLSALQRFAHKGVSIEFEWSEATGFKSASLSDPPGSGLLGTIIAPLDRSVISQTRPRIASEMRNAKWKKATGCVIPEMLVVLPVVLGLDHLSLSKCVILDPEVTELMKASGRGDLAGVRQQIALGSKVNAKDQLGNTALTYAINYSGTADVISVLASAGADVNAKDRFGKPLLFNAVASGGYEAPATEKVRALIAAGANVHANGPEGETALAFAERIQRSQIALLLKKANGRR